MSVAEIASENLSNIYYEITQMLDTDLKQVVDIEENTGLSRWGYEAYRMELFNNPMAIMRVARGVEPINIERRVLGFVAARVTLDELHINNIATHPNFRRIRIGSTLMNEVVTQSRLYGACRCILEVRASNFSAQALYAKMGFRTIGRRRDYYTSPIEDALVMQLMY
ncbi:MAG: ribosomal protein S18-alanine N-acetyltransferase [Acidobacteriota bacterium]